MTKRNTRALLAAHGVRPSKALGQHFLADANMAAHIVRLAGVAPGDRVVEVGPGLGSLTLALCAAGARVLAVELDHRLVEALPGVLGGLPVDVVEADALAVDWPSLLAGGERWTMVSNLPYNVATPVVLRALETAPMIDRFLVMVQREVGERLAASPGTRASGAVSLKVAYHARAEVVGAVPPAVFVPKPKVESVLVRLDRRARPPVAGEPERMFALVRAGFATRRKTLRRALAAELGGGADAVFRRAGVDPSARAEQLSLAQWAALAQAEAPGGSPEVRVDARAKVTLSLRITGRRADGYHEVDALVVPVSEPHDEVVVRPAPRTTVAVSGPCAAGVPGDATNLAARAAGAVGVECAIELHKGIPPGGGLGGGSADAAAVLHGAPGAAGAPIGDDALDRIAAALGADVPFCLRARGAMRVGGIGDEMEPVALPELWIVVAMPRFGCATAEVYRTWDALGGPAGDTVEIDGLPPLRNDLEPAAHVVEPKLAAFKVLVERAAGAPALLAGSGSSYAVVFRTRVEAEAARDRIADVVEGRIVVGRTVEAGVRLVPTGDAANGSS